MALKSLRFLLSSSWVCVPFTWLLLPIGYVRNDIMWPQSLDHKWSCSFEYLFSQCFSLGHSFLKPSHNSVKRFSYLKRPHTATPSNSFRWAQPWGHPCPGASDVHEGAISVLGSSAPLVVPAFELFESPYLFKSYQLRLQTLWSRETLFPWYLVWIPDPHNPGCSPQFRSLNLEVVFLCHKR